MRGITEVRMGPLRILTGDLVAGGGGWCPRRLLERKWSCASDDFDWVESTVVVTHEDSSILSPHGRDRS
jgi:hypothetical protein